MKDFSNGANDTLWSLVIKAAYRKRRSKRRIESEDEPNNLSNVQDHQNPTKSTISKYDCNNMEYRTGDISNTDYLLKYLLDGNKGGTLENSKSKCKPSSNNVFDDLFLTENLVNESNPRLSLDCKGEITFDEGNSSSKGGSIDWLGIMEGRVYVNENMAGTSVQPYEGAYKKSKSIRWSPEQTNKFYEALSIFGTDLMLVKSVFPEFTDKQVHDKFKMEEKRNKSKLDEILIHSKRKLTKKDIQEFKERYLIKENR
ncbi:uncharacterized protein CMU_015430 [Cryptosporidium muris RN66]|uniref:Transcription factor TFIIIB component B'' Myb domain-containing protein n=1 Tax=Cryptosporidium muris (strain RN66) TaxID=441375 RepID=B6AEC0_CRYMR|nr:uncharacterized protein CMU_015430 [Cryptosporidium muris RN66]EEA06866.1 hypothetical protein, conserved [Cryptosporidium muris RN66]|eukprot:XP_002141215.1 hypothetical protein [Cryptosporidium muris RN66]